MDRTALGKMSCDGNVPSVSIVGDNLRSMPMSYKLSLKFQYGRPQKDEVLSLGEVGKKRRLDIVNLGGHLAFGKMLKEVKFRQRISSKAFHPEGKGLAGLCHMASQRLR